MGDGTFRFTDRRNPVSVIVGGFRGSPSPADGHGPGVCGVAAGVGRPVVGVAGRLRSSCSAILAWQMRLSSSRDGLVFAVAGVEHRLLHDGRQHRIEVAFLHPRQERPDTPGVHTRQTGPMG